MDMERLLRNNKASCEAAAHSAHVLEEKEHGAEKLKLLWSLVNIKGEKKKLR